MPLRNDGQSAVAGALPGRGVKTFPIQGVAEWYWNRPQKIEPETDTTARAPENEQRKR